MAEGWGCPEPWLGRGFGDAEPKRGAGLAWHAESQRHLVRLVVAAAHIDEVQIKSHICQLLPCLACG